MGKAVCSFAVDDRLFQKSAIFKAAYLFIDQYYIRFYYAEEHSITIEITAKTGSLPRSIEDDFSNELISQMLRYLVSEENKNVRELILGRALYSTCMDLGNSQADENSIRKSTPSLDDIAVSWFDRNE